MNQTVHRTQTRNQDSTGNAALKTLCCIVLLSISALPVTCGGRFSPRSIINPTFEIPREPPPPPPPPGAAGFAGVGQLTPLDDGVEASWAPILDANGPDLDFTYAVFVATDGQPQDFNAPTVVSDAGADRIEVRGMAPDTSYQVVVRAVSSSDPQDLDVNEVTLSGLVAAFLHVDVAVGGGGDGSAARPFNTINQGVASAIQSGNPANLLIVGGTYVEQVGLLGNVHLYGAYATGFQSGRDRTQNATVLAPAAGGSVALRILANPLATMVDGLEIAGLRSVGVGIDLREADFQLSNSSVTRFTAEGMTATSKNRTSRLDLHRILIADCGTEGLEARGAFQAALTSSAFVRNGNEGAEFDDLSVEKLGQSTLWVRSCSFLENGDDGLDVDLNELEPLIGGTSEDGTIQVVVQRCVASDNSLWGIVIDIDFDALDEITAWTYLKDNQAKRNLRDGILLDADQPGLFVLSGNRTSANRGSGVAVTSTLERAPVYITNHWDLGSSLDGVGVFGPADAFLSHVGVTGSGAAPVKGNGAARMVNGALWLSPLPEDVVVEYSYQDVLVAGDGNFTGTVDVAIAPVGSFFLLQAGATDRITLPPNTPLSAGEFIEFDDDDEAHEVTRIEGNVAFFDPPASAAPRAGTFVSRYLQSDVSEDPRLLSGSQWIDAGDPVEPDPDDSITDVGILGGRLAEFQPQRTGLRFPLVPDRYTPGMGPATGPLAVIEVRMTRLLDPLTVTGSTFEVTVDGAPRSGTIGVDRRTITFTPDQPIQAGLVRVSLQRQISDTFGVVLDLPMSYLIDVQ